LLALGFCFLLHQGETISNVLPSFRSILGAGGLAACLCRSSDTDLSSLLAGVLAETLQEVDQEIIHYKECNRMMQAALSSVKNLVLKGMVCGYKSRGKDSCQVSSWALPSVQVAGLELSATSSITSSLS
jgi:hypothetical protein